MDTAAAAKAAADQALTDAQSANAAAAEAIAALESEKTALEARNAELQAQMADPAPAEPSDAKMKEAELAKLKAEAAFQADPTYQAQLAWDQADVQLNTKTADAVARVNAAQLLLDQCSTALIARDEAETALEVAKAAVGGDKAARAKVAVLLSAGFKAAEEEVPVTNGAFVYEEMCIRDRSPGAGHPTQERRDVYGEGRRQSRNHTQRRDPRAGLCRRFAR